MAKQICPVCGNDIVVKPKASLFRCRFCRRLIEASVVVEHKKRRIKLEEALDV